MLSGLLIGAFAIVGISLLFVLARRDHRAAISERASLLDGLSASLELVQRRLGADGFPAITGRLADRRDVTVELIADTIVTRRLPQLWLVVPVREQCAHGAPSFGALARPTGAEFYSRIGGLDHRVTSPATSDAPLMIRADHALDERASETLCKAVDAVFRDRRIKEILVTPRGARIVCQAAEGDRGAHLILRQVRFATSPIGANTLARAVADADALRAALDPVPVPQQRLTA